MAEVKDSSRVVIHPPTLQKRFLRLQNTQDSINGLSTWCLQKRAHARDIIAVWLSTFEKTTPAMRLTLLYLANDVIQFSTAKHIPDFLDEWKGPLLQAIALVRGEKEIRRKVERILSIWIDRRIYSKAFIEKLLISLNKAPASKPPSASIPDTKERKPSTNGAGPKSERNLQKEMVARVANFQPIDFVRKMKDAEECHRKTELAEEKLGKLPGLKDSSYNVTPAEFIARFKDRKSAEAKLVELNAMIQALEDASNALREDVRVREELVSCAETAVHHYRVQEKEAKTVSAAYDNYLEKVRKQKRKVEELELESPVPSPKVDAPSPTPEDGMELQLEANSPVEMLDDIPLPATMPSLLPSSISQPLSTFLSNVSLPPSVQAELNNRLALKTVTSVVPPPPSVSASDWPPGEVPPTTSWNNQEVPPPEDSSPDSPPWDTSDGLTWGEGGIAAPRPPLPPAPPARQWTPQSPTPIDKDERNPGWIAPLDGHHQIQDVDERPPPAFLSQGTINHPFSRDQDYRIPPPPLPNFNHPPPTRPHQDFRPHFQQNRQPRPPPPQQHSPQFNKRMPLVGPRIRGRGGPWLKMGQAPPQRDRFHF